MSSDESVAREALFYLESGFCLKLTKVSIRLFYDTEGADCKFVVGNEAKVYPVHRSILFEHSPYFKRALNTSHHINDKDGCPCILLLEFQPAEVESVLRCIYHHKFETSNQLDSKADIDQLDRLAHLVMHLGILEMMNNVVVTLNSRIYESNLFRYPKIAFKIINMVYKADRNLPEETVVAGIVKFLQRHDAACLMSTINCVLDPHPNLFKSFMGALLKL